METKRIVFTGGGTGGHVYPNIAIYEVLREQYPGSAFLYIGTARGAESRIVKNIPHPIEFAEIVSRGMPQNMKSLAGLVSLFHILRGAIQSYFILQKFKPDIVIGSGGYVAAPVLLAASALKLKVFIHEQNAVPGRMNQFMAQFADRIAVSFASTAAFFPAEKTIFTGYPLRRSILYSRDNDIKKKLRLPEKNKVVFIFGGSTGARTINNAVAEIIPTLLAQDNLTVILATGRGYSSEYRAYEDTVKILDELGIPPEIEGKLIIREYFDNIDEIYSIADLIVCRAGAGTIKEITTLGIPSILVPKIDLPGDHQVLNAREVEKTGGATVVYEEVKYGDGKRVIYLSETRLLESILGTIGNSDILFNMRKNLHQIERKNSTELILKELEQIFKGKEKGEEKQIKIFYLHSQESEKALELVFPSTRLGNSLFCDQYIDGLSEETLIDLKMMKDGEKIVVRKIKGKVGLNGKEIDRWAEIHEEDRLEIGGQTFTMKNYFEKVPRVRAERTEPRKAGAASWSTAISRIGDLIRQVVMAAFFGASNATDIFVIGYTIANFFRRLVAESALQESFIPIFSRLFYRSSRKKTWEAASSITNFTLLLAMLITLAGIFLSPWLIKFLFPIFEARKVTADAIQITRLLFPWLFLVTLSAVMTTYLKAFNRFGLAEMSVVFFNLAAVTGMILLYPLSGPYTLVYGLLLGALGQIVFLIPILTGIFSEKAAAFSYKPVIHFKSRANIKYYAQLTPSAIDGLLGKVSELVALIMAAPMGIGAVAFLNFGLVIFRFPFVVLAQVVNNMILKDFSTQVALFDQKKTRQVFSDSIKANIFLLTPLTILLFMLAGPIVSLVFERGSFLSSQVLYTAQVLQCYAIGLVGWGLHGVTVRIFADRLDNRTSLVLNSVALVFFGILGFFLSKTSLKFAGIALATSISFLLFSLVRILVLRSKLEKEDVGIICLKDILASLGKTTLSALLMVLVMIQARFVFEMIDLKSRVATNLVLLVSLSFIGISIYLLSSLLLKNTVILAFKRRAGLKENNHVPAPMLSPSRFLDRVSKNSAAYKDDYLYKINVYTSSSHWETRNVGVKLIGLFGDKTKADYLMEILRTHTENGFIRRNAVTSLKDLNIWNLEVKQLMIKLLDDSYYEVRVAALGYLSKHSTASDYEYFKDTLRRKLKHSSLEEKLSSIRLIARIGNLEDIDYLRAFHLSSNSLVREEYLELLYSFYRRKILSAERVRENMGQVLITSNNLNPEFKLKVIIEKIYKEIEKG